MATSGSYDFSVNFTQLCNAAMRVLGLLSEGQTASGNQLTDARQACNLLLKQFAVSPNPMFRGLRVWNRQRGTLALSAKSSYVLAPAGGDLAIQNPTQIISVLRRDTSNNDTPLREMLVDEWEELSRKGRDTYTPTAWFAERGTSSTTIYLDAIPSDITDTLIITYLRPIQDIDANANDFEMAPEWYRWLKFALAKEIAPEYGAPWTQALEVLFQESLLLANSYSPDRVDVIYEPERY